MLIIQSKSDAIYTCNTKDVYLYAPSMAKAVRLRINRGYRTRAFQTRHCVINGQQWLAVRKLRANARRV